MIFLYFHARKNNYKFRKVLVIIMKHFNDRVTNTKTNTQTISGLW